MELFDLLAIALGLIVWVVLVRYIFPRLGIPT
jgi:hypothetical protein